MGQRILFFDGVCNLCNWLVDFLIRNDRDRKLFFAPLQGPTAEKYVPAEVRKNLFTVVMWDQNRLYTQSDAVVQALRHLPPPWSWFPVVKIIPKPLRNIVYNFVAKHRYKWFGKHDTCRVPTPEERSRFLD